MTLNNGKSKLYYERRIFDLIYGEKKDLSVEHRDKPDFWITNNINEKFGVEITQLYSDESQARLQCIPNYSEELRAGLAKLDSGISGKAAL
jgi:hypothetical protein